MFDDLRSSVSQLSPSLLDISVVTVVEFCRSILVGIYVAMNIEHAQRIVLFFLRCFQWAIE